MDQMVKQAQEWVNSTYKGRAGYEEVQVTGKTGWSTMWALTRALQLELGITETATDFGPTTLKEIAKKCPINTTSNTNSNIVKIIQAALYCKGYGPGGITGTYGPGTQSAIASMQKDLGATPNDGAVTPKLFKALLTMDAYVLVNNGSEKIRKIQQWLNSKYINRADFFYMPCDGHYSRDVQKALMFAIQYEEGLQDGTANGYFGPTTQEKIKSVVLKEGSTGAFVYLFQAALIFNGYDVPFDGNYSAFVATQLKQFQNFSLLKATGVSDFQTWASLLVSTGDPERQGKACDCITEVTPERAKTLVAAGYQTVGRYLTNANVKNAKNKKIQDGEINNIFAAGLSIFPIYQTNGGDKEYFNANQGKEDAIKAYEAAKYHGFPSATTIYFAVDFDATGDEIKDKILPHFQAINEQMKKLGSYYDIGVYGSRNVCIQVSDKKYATYSFVSGMSTGFSGNLGFPLPRNWAFDQIKEYTIGSGNGSISIDKDIKSGRDNGVTKIDKEKLSLTLQLLEMAGNSYAIKEIDKFVSPGNWLLYKQESYPKSDFDVQVYRKEISTDKYLYTVAFRGSQEPMDWVVDVVQVVGNVGGLQADDAANFVKKLIETDRDKISHLYITGHSLGGYLTQYVQSEIIDGNLPWIKSSAVTFNAPGIGFLDVFDKVFAAKMSKKILNDHDFSKYDDLLLNHQIIFDAVSLLGGDNLGKVIKYAPKHLHDPLDLKYHHSLKRFVELDLK
ncbi:glycoside hydrolase domain-containing protein [Bacillus pseudomycoides]|uniref:glycoside hydrolase domain-containing protein n=1 Tax=Bacillus pseudomycoides TaxID=64104 RepID=UPI000BEFE546|nr:glycoside hydrolase domain-containing protein [Bacillus pseudomycoides]PEM35717.1 peptidoglycan-binding protein [Bacillus pseudomycoides]